MNLKPCPFCGGADVVDIAKPVNDEGDMESFVECYTCGAMVAHSSLAGLHLQIWNTRATPTKAWEWVKMDHGPHYVSFNLKAKVVGRGSGVFEAYVDDKFISSSNGGMGFFSSVELAQAACVAYVEGKLKEWLV